MNEATPYQKRLKLVQEEMARLLHPDLDDWIKSSPFVAKGFIAQMLPLAIRQIEREAEAYKLGAKEWGLKVGDVIEMYLKQQGYTE